VVKTLPDIKAYAEKVMNVHSGRHPELIPIRQLVEEVYSELMAHMVKEEKILFPYIKELEAATNGKQPLHASHFGTVQNPINMMEMEHEAVSENLNKIRQLSNNYALPEDACASYSLLYRLLDEFEQDLILHVHLENNILFPKALEIEKKLQ
jgi:regulator of cell morphogenesis and NO signaling